MSETQYVKLWRSGENQAVQIPRELELKADIAIIRREGERLVIEPVPTRSLLALLSTLEPIDEEFAPIEELPASEVGL